MNEEDERMADYTVAFWQANQSSLDSGPSFNILDTASNISAALDALERVTLDISVIKISDNAPVNLNVAQLNSDATAISILVNANSTPATLKITDTAANIGANFATLNQQSQIHLRSWFRTIRPCRSRRRNLANDSQRHRRSSSTPIPPPPPSWSRTVP